jgi:hypothetical protein
MPGSGSVPVIYRKTVRACRAVPPGDLDERQGLIGPMAQARRSDV